MELALKVLIKKCKVLGSIYGYLLSLDVGPVNLADCYAQ